MDGSLNVGVFFFFFKVGRSGDEESQEDVLMDEAPSNMSQASTLQANREGRTDFCKCAVNMPHLLSKFGFYCKFLLPPPSCRVCYWNEKLRNISVDFVY